MNRRADWFSWSLQFVVGLVAGALFSALFMRGGRRSIPLVAQEECLPFMLGAALVGAALASRFGDRLWLGDSYRIIPPDEPRHSAASRKTSAIVGGIGGLMVFLAIVRSFGWLA